MEVRNAREEDAVALRDIYGYYVEKTAVTFEYGVPTEEEFARRIRETMKKYPYLVLEEDGRVCGYAYAGVFKNRPAYDWAVETTIYLKSDARGKGLGETLYAALEEALKERGFLNAYACIAATQQEDETLTNASRRFHERMGYRLCGTFSKCGYKFGRWYDMIWMEKHLGEHPADPVPVK